MTVLRLFGLDNRHVVVLGGRGLLGRVAMETVEELGGIPICMDQDTPLRARPCSAVINCAIGNQKPVGAPLMRWHTDIDVGLTYAAQAMECFYVSLAVTKGAYLNVGSDLSLKAPDPKRYAPQYKPVSYSVIKHGIVGLTRYYAKLWGPEGIRVNCLCPGSIDQGQAVPDCALGRLAQPNEMKGAIAFLLSDASSYVTGSIISVDGGSTC